MKILKIIAKVWLYVCLAAIICGVCYVGYQNPRTSFIIGVIALTIASLFIIWGDDVDSYGGHDDGW